MRLGRYVYAVGLGLWEFVSEFLGAAALLLILAVVGSFVCATVQRRSDTRKPEIAYYILLGFLVDIEE